MALQGRLNMFATKLDELQFLYFLMKNEGES
jgi:hypothetical protein